jgi:hypothetical protein
MALLARLGACREQLKSKQPRNSANWATTRMLRVSHGKRSISSHTGSKAFGSLLAALSDAGRPACHGAEHDGCMSRTARACTAPAPQFGEPNDLLMVTLLGAVRF